MAAKQNDTSLLQALFEKRDKDRERIARSAKVVEGDKLPVENNEMGLFKWYLHPDKPDAAIRTIVLWTQEIPPGSKSGKERHQGGRIHYVQEGRGYTEIDGTRYDWEKGDLILLPIKPNGVVFQHFNADLQRRARLICTEPNWYDALGVDLGAGFEQLENSPDFPASNSTGP